MMASLVGILYKFRRQRLAIDDDIEKMFHQVWVDDEDHDIQLWSWSIDESIKKLKMRVITFDAAYSPTLAKYIKKYLN